MFQTTSQYSSIRVPNFDSYPYVVFYSRGQRVQNVAAVVFVDVKKWNQMPNIDD